MTFLKSFLRYGIIPVVGVLFWRFMFGEVFSDAVLNKLKPGMTTNEVLVILGRPAGVSGGSWYYTRPLMFNSGLVSFDESNHLTSAIND